MVSSGHDKLLFISLFVCMCVCVFAKARGQLRFHSSRSIHLAFLRHSDLGLGQLASEPQASISPALGFETLPHAWFKYGDSGAIPQCLALFPLSYLLAPLSSFCILSFRWLLRKIRGLGIPVSAAIWRITFSGQHLETPQEEPGLIHPPAGFFKRVQKGQDFWVPMILSEGTSPYSFVVLSQPP